MPSPTSPRAKFKRLSLDRLPLLESPDALENSDLSSASDTESPLSSGQVTPRSGSSSREGVISPRSRSLSAGIRLKNMRFSPRGFETLAEDEKEEGELAESTSLKSSPQEGTNSGSSSPATTARGRTRSMRFSGTLDPLTEGTVEEEIAKEKKSGAHHLSKSSRASNEGMRKSTGSAPITPDKKVISLKMSSLKSPRSPSQEQKSPRDSAPLSPRQFKSQQALQKLKDSGAYQPSTERPRPGLPPLLPPKPSPIILLLGAAGAGKSSLMQRILHNTFEVPSQRISKLEQSVKLSFEPGESQSPAAQRHLSISSQSISEAEEDESASEDGSSSSSIAETSSASSSMSSSTLRGAVVAVARLDFLESTGTLKAALARGVARKILLYAYDVHDPSSLSALTDLAATVQESQVATHTVLVGCKSDSEASPRTHLSTSTSLVPHIERHIRRRSVEEIANETFIQSPRSQMSMSDHFRRRSMDATVSLQRVPQGQVDTFKETFAPAACFEVSSKSGEGILALKEHLRQLLGKS